MFSDPQQVITESFVAEGMTVADFGAGVGFYTIPLARRVGPYGRVFAVDVHGDLLRKVKNEAVKSGFENVDIVQGDLELPNGSGLLTASIDRIIIANTLFQTDSPEKVVLEAKRVLKYDGKVAVIDWEESFGQIGPHPDHVITKEEARDIFERNGFILESFINAGKNHYGMLYVLTETPMPGASKNIKSDKAPEDMNPSLILPPVDLRAEQ